MINLIIVVFHLRCASLIAGMLRLRSCMTFTGEDKDTSVCPTSILTDPRPRKSTLFQVSVAMSAMNVSFGTLAPVRDASTTQPPLPQVGTRVAFHDVEGRVLRGVIEGFEVQSNVRLLFMHLAKVYQYSEQGAQNAKIKRDDGVLVTLPYAVLYSDEQDTNMSSIVGFRSSQRNQGMLDSLEPSSRCIDSCYPLDCLVCDYVPIVCIRVVFPLDTIYFIYRSQMSP